MVNITRPDGSRASGSKRTGRIEGSKIFVSNIDFGCTHQDLKDVFNQVGEVAFVEMLKDSNQRPNGCALIRFKQPSTAEEAIKVMNRFELSGRKLVVKDEKDAPKDKLPRDRKRQREDDHYDRPLASSSMYGNTYGLTLQFLESLGIEGPLVSRVFVANLNYNVNEDMLKELFGVAGKVLDTELVRGEDGKSKGFGFIDYEHPIEAVQAISMLHNQMYQDRPLSVQLTRKERKKDGPMKLPPGLKSIGLGLGINGTPLKDVARTVEAGNQAGLLGAMPTQNLGSCLPLSSLGLGVGGLGLSSSLTGADLGSGLGSAMTSLTSDIGSSLSRGSGMGLMDRAGGLGLGLNSNLSSSMRSLVDSTSLATSSFGNFGASSLTSQRNSVQISNLPSTYSWKSLQELCMPFGDVTFAKITSRGVGVVQFENEAAARRAADMLDHQRFEGRFLETRLI